MADVGIGSTVYIFDHNRRVYTGGGLGSRIIWREHFRPVKIVGETSRSWITDFYGTKLLKKGGKYLTSEEEIDRAEYVEENAYRIADCVRRIKDYDLLKSVAELIRYEEREK